VSLENTLVRHTSPKCFLAKDIRRVTAQHTELC
jgi:hypothetical protein